MIEEWRYQRAIRANAVDRNPPGNNLQVFLDQEFITQRALSRLKVTITDPPGKILAIDQLHMVRELVQGRQVPYLIEIIGMPRAGKSTSVNRYLERQWTRGQRDRVSLISRDEVPETAEQLKADDLFAYSTMLGNSKFLDIIGSLKNANRVSLFLQDRGMTDRRIFRRALFCQGKVHPGVMEDEREFEVNLETSPMPVSGLIMCLVRPAIALEREGPREKPGTVMNQEFLEILYEQYLRFHQEIISGKNVFPCYTCLDMEGTPDANFIGLHNAINQIVDARRLCASDLILH